MFGDEGAGELPVNLTNKRASGTVASKKVVSQRKYRVRAEPNLRKSNSPTSAARGMMVMLAQSEKEPETLKEKVLKSLENCKGEGTSETTLKEKVLLKD